MGITTEDKPLVHRGNVYGSYIHGLFDTDQVAKAVIGALFAAKGLDVAEVSAFDIKAYKDSQYDLLAQGMRETLDMDYIYKVLEQGAAYDVQL